MGFLLRASLSCLVLTVGVASVSSPPEEIRKKPSLMRKATDGKEAAKLESDGIVVDAKPKAKAKAKAKAEEPEPKAKAKAEEPAVNEDPEEYIELDEADKVEAKDKSWSSMCRAVFVRGETSTGACKQIKDHKPIEDQHSCKIAAIMTKVPWGGECDGENIRCDDQKNGENRGAKHPVGCFSLEDKDGTTKMYFSALETQDCTGGTCEGEPVCWTLRYHLGTQGSTDVNNNCPADYEDIELEQDCRAAASCSGLAAAAKMRVGEEYFQPITNNKGDVEYTDTENMPHKKFVGWCLFKAARRKVKQAKQKHPKVFAFFNDLKLKKFKGKLEKPEGVPECVHKCHLGHQRRNNGQVDETMCFKAEKPTGFKQGVKNVLKAVTGR